MNAGYLIYQAERPRSAAEQRQTDIVHAELARSVSRGWRALAAPLRALRLTTGRLTTGRLATGRLASGRLATRRPAGRPAGHQAECVTAECPAGRHA